MVPVVVGSKLETVLLANIDVSSVPLCKLTLVVNWQSALIIVSRLAAPREHAADTTDVPSEPNL